MLRFRGEFLGVASALMGLESLTERGRVLLVIAAPGEVDAVIGGLGAATACPEPWTLAEVSDRIDLCLCGVGKANAAGGTARVLDPARHGVVLSVGICGSLPRTGAPMLGVGASVVGTRSENADEGIELPGGGFAGCESMGFPLGPGGDGVDADPRVLDALSAVADEQGVIATVSTCAGTDKRAAAIAARTGALVEAMEGAAIGRVAYELGVPFGELRVVSNNTGDRDKQAWDLERAFAALGGVLGRLLDL